MYEFSQKALGTRPSAIREIIKNMNDPSMISFAGGNPAVECFPIEEIKKYSAKILEEQPVRMLLYGTTEGVPSLRESALAFANRYGRISTAEDDIAILTGSQQAMDFTARVFCNEGDTVVAEDPSFVGALNSFRAYGAKTVGVPMEDDGVDIAALEKAFAAVPKPKLFYVIPNFQNPTGLVTSAAKRQVIYDLAVKYDVPVLEDNPYGELRFEGEYMPALKSLDTKGLVIYLGTFSKILAPGYRLGWVCADDAILSKFNFMEQAASLQASTIGQMEVAKWIDMFDLDGHVTKIRECYRKRRTVMLDTLERELPKECTFTHPDGGLFAWVVLPEYMDAKDLQMKCLARKVAFVPGGSFFPNGGHENTLRLNYSCMPEDKIVKGITALCQTIRENLR